MPAAEANQHDEQGADHEEVAGKAEAGLAGDEAKENEDPAANPARLSFGKNPQNLASKAGKRCRKLAG